MKSFNESEIKYLAGLLDADGSLSFRFCPSSSGKVFAYLVLCLSASKKIDRKNYLKDLGARAGGCVDVTYKNENHNDATRWAVQSRTELNMLLPRLIKHMVVKGKHWQVLFDKYTQLKGVDVSGKEDEIKKFSEDSRVNNTGPVKPKNHPTWAWVAGYLDGDGCYTLSNRAIHVGCITHKNDSHGINLLHKAFGGTIYEPREDNSQLWRRGLGKSQSSFATHFLRKVLQHSRLKKWKIEQMLAFHNQSQRLIDFDPTG